VVLESSNWATGMSAWVIGWKNRCFSLQQHGIFLCNCCVLFERCAPLLFAAAGDAEADELIIFGGQHQQEILENISERKVRFRCNQPAAVILSKLKSTFISIVFLSICGKVSVF
jgi:hypothetical protein